MTQPLPSMKSPIGRVMVNGKEFGMCFLLPPWNSYFQQISQAGSEVLVANVGSSPFEITANANGTMIILSGTVTGITLTRGVNSFNLDVGNQLIPIRINDMLAVTYSVLPTITFLPD